MLIEYKQRETTSWDIKQTLKDIKELKSYNMLSDHDETKLEIAWS